MHNIQPDGSWRDPNAQAAIDIGQGKLNPNGASYTAVQIAHATYGSPHVNSLWGPHGNAPAAPAGSRWLGSGSWFGAGAAPAPAGWHGPGPRRDDPRPVVRSDRPPMSVAEVRNVLGYAPLTAAEEAELAARYAAAAVARKAAQAQRAQQMTPREWFKLGFVLVVWAIVLWTVYGMVFGYRH